MWRKAELSTAQRGEPGGASWACPTSLCVTSGELMAEKGLGVFAEGISCVSAGATSETRLQLGASTHRASTSTSKPETAPLGGCACSKRSPEPCLGLGTGLKRRRGAEKWRRRMEKRRRRMEKQRRRMAHCSSVLLAPPALQRDEAVQGMQRLPSPAGFSLHHPLPLGCNSSQSGSVLAAPSSNESPRLQRFQLGAVYGKPLPCSGPWGAGTGWCL